MKCITVNSFSQKLTKINPFENTLIFPALKVFRSSGQIKNPEQEW